MKNLKEYFVYLQSAIIYKGLYLLCFFFSLPAIAQIPQNIEVEGEPEQGWQYLLYIVALLIVIAVIFLITKIVKGAKKSD